MTVAARCPGCPHAEHRDQCPAKGPGGIALVNPDTGEHAGFLCRGRFPCPCPRGRCHTCRAQIAGASPFPIGSADEIDIDVGSAGEHDGLVAVASLPDGTLGARRLQPGDPLPATAHGIVWWRAREHRCAA